MEAYIYNADIYCEECGEAIKDDCRSVPKQDREDSDNYPQGPFADGGGESDCPQHCGNCHVFLENPLTSHGVADVVESHRNNPSDITREWIDYYGLSDHFLDDDDILTAIQPIYQLNWANIAEENGESFSGCEITEVCPMGPDEELLAIGRPWVRTLELTHGSLIEAFQGIGLEWNDYSDALYHLFMGAIGHGIGFDDYAYENDLENPFEHSRVTLDDSDVFCLAESAYLEANPESSED